MDWSGRIWSIGFPHSGAGRGRSGGDDVGFEGAAELVAQALACAVKACLDAALGAAGDDADLPVREAFVVVEERGLELVGEPVDGRTEGGNGFVAFKPFSGMGGIGGE